MLLLRWFVGGLLLGLLLGLSAGVVTAGDDELRSRWKNAQTLSGGCRFVCAHHVASSREMRYGVGQNPLVGPSIRRNRANTTLEGRFTVKRVHVEASQVVFEGRFQGQGSIHDERYADADYVATDEGRARGALSPEAVHGHASGALLSIRRQLLERTERA